MNRTSFFYAHTDQWRYEKLGVDEVLSPLRRQDALRRQHDRLQRARRAHGLAAVGAAARRPIRCRWSRDAAAAGMEPKDYVVKALKDGTLKHELRGPGRSGQLAAQHVRLALQPARLVAARATSISSSTCSARSTACRARTSGEEGARSPRKSSGTTRRPKASSTCWSTLDFRMSTTCLYSDIVLPTATWYEKNDLNTRDMHPFIHPLSTAVDPAWESRSDWEIYKGIAKSFSEVCAGHLGVEKDVVLTPLHARHARRARRSRSTSRTGRRGECELDPRQDRAADRGGRARLSRTLQALHRARPADGQGRQRRQGHRLEHRRHEVEQLGELNGLVTDEGATKGMPKIETDIDACEVILMLAPETNGHVAVKAWEALGEADRPRAHAPGAAPRGREDPLPRHPGAAAQDHHLADLVAASRARRSATTPATPTCTS